MYSVGLQMSFVLTGLASSSELVDTAIFSVEFTLFKVIFLSIVIFFGGL